MLGLGSEFSGVAAAARGQVRRVSSARAVAAGPPSRSLGPVTDFIMILLCNMYYTITCYTFLQYVLLRARMFITETLFCTNLQKRRVATEETTEQGVDFRFR